MAAVSTISSKGQITLPIEVRRRLGVIEGDRVEFIVESGQVVVVRPVRSGENPFVKDVGRFPGIGTLEDINAWVADMRDEDERG